VARRRKEKPPIWARRKGEPPSAYRYAFAYFQAGAIAKRSIDKIEEYLNPNSAPKAAGQEVSKRSAKTRQFFRLSKKWRWVARAAAYDAWLDDKKAEAMELFATQDAEKWAARERDLREKRFSQSQEFISQADTMLKAPLFEQKRIVEAYEDGREKVIQQFLPSKWAKRDAMRYAVGGHAMASAAIKNEDALATKVLELDDWTKLVPFVAAGE